MIIIGPKPGSTKQPHTIRPGLHWRVETTQSGSNRLEESRNTRAQSFLFIEIRLSSDHRTLPHCSWSRSTCSVTYCRRRCQDSKVVTGTWFAALLFIPALFRRRLNVQVEIGSKRSSLTSAVNVWAVLWCEFLSLRVLRAIWQSVCRVVLLGRPVRG